MSTQMMSDLLVDLSAEQQQLLAGGQQFDTSDEEEGESEGARRETPRTRVYKVRSAGILRVQKLR